MSNLQQNAIRFSRNPFRTHELTNLLYPSQDGGYRDTYRAGWLPSFFNQQWGGSQFGTELQDGATGNTYKFSAATGNVEDNTYVSATVQGLVAADAAVRTWQAQGFKVSEATALSAIWVKLYRIQGAVAGNAGNLTLQILPDAGAGTLPTGSTPITNGTATAISQKTLTTKTDGEWYRFVFATPPTLVAGTTYHIAVKSSIAVDATNYVVIKASTGKKYPLGQSSQGDATPAWSASATIAWCFLAETAATAQVIQTGGVFENRFSFTEGTPLNQSRSLTQPLKNFFDGKEFTYIGVWSTLTKDKTFADFLWGMDHDRVVLRCNVATGFPQVDVYDNLGVLRTVTGNIDCSTGNHQVGVHIRARGDGVDKIDLIIDGKVNATLGTLTLNFDNSFRDLGTAWVGGGFNLAPAWGSDSKTTFISTTLGGTWGAFSGATVANAASVINGKLCINKGGFASTDLGSYTRPAMAFVNATGWVIKTKARVQTGTNTVSGSVLNGLTYSVNDGSKVVNLCIQEYFLQVGDNTTGWLTVQGDFKSQEHIFTLEGKGSDYWLYVDGKLVVDGTARLALASATNTLAFGDLSATASENLDAVISYVKYSNTGPFTPQATSGSLSEFAVWSGDKTSYAVDLYNQGTFNSVKRYCGMERNYVENTIQRDIKNGVVASPTSSTNAYILVPDLEAFSIGSQFYLDMDNTVATSGAINFYGAVSLDGVVSSLKSEVQSSATSAQFSMTIRKAFITNLGLHKCEGRWNSSSGTMTAWVTNRNLTVEAKS